MGKFAKLEEECNSHKDECDSLKVRIVSLEKDRDKAQEKISQLEFSHQERIKKVELRSSELEEEFATLREECRAMQSELERIKSMEKTISSVIESTIDSSVKTALSEFIALLQPKLKS